MKKALLKFSSTIALPSFILSLFLLKIYPFYVLPIQSSIFTSHTLAKVILIAIFFLYIPFTKPVRGKQMKIVLFLIASFLLSQSLSILVANDIISFFKIYHNTVISLIIFILAYYLTLENKNNFKIFTLFSITMASILTLLEAIFRIIPTFFFPLISFFIQEEVVNALRVNINEGKYSLAFGYEMLFPFLLIPIMDKKTKPLSKVFFVILCLLMIFLTIISNFRSRLIVLAFVVLSSAAIFVIKKQISIKQTYFKLISVFIFVVLTSIVYLAGISSNYFLSYNIFDRFLLQSNSSDIGTINTRLNQYERSLELFNSSPILGIGLGNYNYIKSATTFGTQSSYVTEFIDFTNSRPHSIFFQELSETGIIGTGTFIILLAYFLLQDAKYFIKLKNPRANIAWVYIVSSWSVIIYALFNPADTLFITAWFWFFRGLIMATYTKAYSIATTT